MRLKFLTFKILDQTEILNIFHIFLSIDFPIKFNLISSEHVLIFFSCILVGERDVMVAD